MKTVTIPTCANPFVVIVNGIKYTYPAGATMEVPDDVAEVIEQHEEAKTEPAPVAPPFAAAPSSGESGGASGGGGIPVIEITTSLNFGGDPNILSAEDAAQLIDALNSNSKCAVVILRYTAVQDTFLCPRVELGDEVKVPTFRGSFTSGESFFVLTLFAEGDIGGALLESI